MIVRLNHSLLIMKSCGWSIRGKWSRFRPQTLCFNNTCHSSFTAVTRVLLGVTHLFSLWQLWTSELILWPVESEWNTQRQSVPFRPEGWLMGQSLQPSASDPCLFVFFYVCISRYLKIGLCTYRWEQMLYSCSSIRQRGAPEAAAVSRDQTALHKEKTQHDTDDLCLAISSAHAPDSLGSGLCTSQGWHPCCFPFF